jgi:ABC-type molybdate transport system substrate-binding protein
MRRILSAILSIAVFAVITVAAIHEHSEGCHNDAHSCQLCVFTKGSSTEPLEFYLPAEFETISVVVFISVVLTPLRSFFPIPASRGPPLV